MSSRKQKRRSDNNFSEALWQAAVSKDTEKVHKLIAKHANMSVTAENGYDQCTPLHWAASQGDLSIVKLLLESGADINAQTTEHGLMPVHEAAINGHSDVVEYLLLHGASLEGRDTKYFFTPLLWSAQYGHHKTVRTLLKHGASVTACDSKQGQTSLHLAAARGHCKVIELLIDKGANVIARDSEVRATPLHAAASSGDVDAAELLLQYGADINAKNKSGNTALHVAAWFGHPDIVHLLISEQADLTVTNKYARTPQDTARESNQYKSKSTRAQVIKMLDSANKVMKLHEATSSGDVHQVKQFSSGLKDGVNVMLEVDYENTNDSDKQTPLHKAAERGDGDVINVLIDNGADVDVKTPQWGYTALHRASHFGHTKAVKTLLKNNADTEVRDYVHGATPLHIAANSNHDETTDVLLKYDAYIDAQDKYGYTPLHRAALHGHIQTCKVLINCGANVEVRNDMHDQTPLHLAVVHGHEHVAELLVKHHARIDSENKDGNTMLHLAAAHNCYNFAEQLVLDIFPLLISYADVQNKDGDTPLHLAAMFGNVAIIRILVLYGCQLNIVNCDGITARELIKLSPQYKTDKDRQRALKIFHVAKEAQGELLTAVFLVIAKKYHMKWPALAKKLNILNYEIKCIAENHADDSEKQCYEMLVLWSLKNFYDTNLFQKLLKILRKWKNRKLIEQVIVKHHERMGIVFKKHKI
ncbi:uncharacterized protein LOC100373654 [Saccoglossus kowalevskii]|uniref:Ankyrin-2-like n=1 Tax=Saccoglossus kowalevskii TaxID=10224 RepID=A0ABM0LZ91_SACKO|nr:PREDICTED: ankyrin-2-like [Saccoglossus kowalevskii]